MSKKLKFKISSALKDIIGRDLITDEFIAVFELVKNSYDAHATKVDITFENIESGNGRIIIKDNGKGMNYDDLINKWLFVAYSAKREGTEEDSFDYRDNIYTNRTFAGAKGIGRFSCDKLGGNLYLETTKKEKNRKTEVLITDWKSFEGDLKDEFIDISVLHETKEKSDFNLKHGTVLVIEDLREDWGRDKYLKLKSSLAKLINPNRGKGEQKFKICLHVPEEKDRDNEETENYKKVEGEIKNFIFDTLGLKTTSIITKVSENGKYITTELIDGGTLIYKIKEKNEFGNLDSINLTLYYLNMSAKLTFTRRMGLSSKAYGHIFLYKNGFRIYPYGEPGEDPLKIDSRKQQGHSRYLGTRDLIGQIEIFSKSKEFKETSSRGDGLIKTGTYRELELLFWKILKRLEKYVVGVQQWGLSIEDEESSETKSRVSDLLANITDSNNLIEFETADNFINILQENQTGSAENVIKNLEKLAIESNDEALIKQTKKVSKKLDSIQRARIEAEQEANIQRGKAEKIQFDLKEKESENLFLKSVKSQDLDEVVSFLHHVGISAGIVDNYLTGLYNKVKSGQTIDNKKLLEILKIVVFENKKIQNISTFATKANFKLYTDAIELNLGEYLQEYVKNVVALATNEGVSLSFKNNLSKPHISNYRPIELNILVDNFLSNSKKAQSTKFSIELNEKGGKLILSFSDNGKGINDEKKKEIFKYGFTTKTEGAGIGLYHIKEIVDRFGGKMEVESEINKGTVFNIII